MQAGVMVMCRRWRQAGQGNLAAAASVLAATMFLPGLARAEPIENALAHAYANNPQLNAERAAVRAVDEAVPQALAGYRPRVGLTADLGRQYSDMRNRPGGPDPLRQTGFMTPRGYGLTATQPFFDGLQTSNRTRAAESQVLAAREALRVMEQSVLLDAATAYMNVLRDLAIEALQGRNVEVLRDQVRQTSERLNIGEVRRTDVAQAESRLAGARSQLLAAQATLVASRAAYRRVIGVEPQQLRPAAPVDRLSPGTLDLASSAGAKENPAVLAAMHGADIGLLNVKIAEGALYPVVTIESSVQKRFDVDFDISQSLQASIVGKVVVPLYQGGGEYSRIREAKEMLGQRRLTVEQIRDQIRSNVVQAWGLLRASIGQIEAAQIQVRAAEIALNGVREEALVGQRTTVEVLNAQQELVSARVALVTLERDRLVSSYGLLSAVGRLSPQTLRLPTAIYNPAKHYHQIRDSWIGVRTPDGR